MRQYRRQLQAESVGFSDQPIENYQLTAREADLGRMAALSSQLRTRRSALWQELDDAQARALELQKARRALHAQGLRGLRELVRSKQVSRNLRVYLERLLGPVN